MVKNQFSYKEIEWYLLLIFQNPTFALHNIWTTVYSQICCLLLICKIVGFPNEPNLVNCWAYVYVYMIMYNLGSEAKPDEIKSLPL